MRSAFCWFSKFCHSQSLSHFAASFIDIRAEASIAKSCKNIAFYIFIKGWLRQINSGKLPKLCAVSTTRQSPRELQETFTALFPFPQVNFWCYKWIFVLNDPSAGSPTETLLRLLLPLSDKVHSSFHTETKIRFGAVPSIHRITQSVGATGGVYKGQGRNQHELMTRAY